jgi:rhodanese-related sulfurtransferase
MKTRIILLGHLFSVLILLFTAAARSVSAQSAATIHQATLMEFDQRTKEISTEELRKILADKSATVFDARPFNEYAISHIPGAVNVSAKPNVPMSFYISDVTEIGRVLKGDKRASIVLYCNGPFCGKSKRLATELLDAGYLSVRRYQLGIPVWRALGGVTQIEQSAIRPVIENDRTAVFIDVRDATEFKMGSIPGAKNLPRSLVKEGKDVGEVKAAKDDGRLPMEDHNTRIIVFGKSKEEAGYVAQAIAKEAFHNASFFDGSFEQLKSVVQQSAAAD